MRNEESEVTDDGDKKSASKPSRWLRRWRARATETLAILGNIFAAGVILGGILVSLYGARYLFYPGDVSTDDALSFAFLSFRFLLILVLLFFLVTLAGLPVMYVLSAPINFIGWLHYKLNTRGVSPQIAPPFVRIVTWRKGYAEWLLIGIFSLIFNGLMIYDGMTYVVGDLIPIFTTGIILSAIIFAKVRKPTPNSAPATVPHWFHAWIRQRSPWFQRMASGGGLIFLTVILGLNFFQDVTWRVMGLRKENATVRLPEINFKIAISHANKNGMIVNPCEQIGSDPILRNVDVLSHNLGKKALLIYPALAGVPDSTERPIVRLEPDSDDVEVVRETNRDRCDEFGADQLFGRGSVSVNAAGRAVLADKFAWLKDEVANTWKVQIVAHRDKSDRVNAVVGTPSTVLQADSVKGVLQNVLGLAPERIESIGEEDAVPKKKCDEEMTKTERRACEKMSRRVEIFVIRQQ